MANQVEEGSKSYFVLRSVNYSRIVLYGILGAVQLPLFILCYVSSGHCNVFAVVAPFVMMFLDAMIIVASRNPFPYFLLASLLICLLNIGIVYLTVFPIIFYLALGLQIDYITLILGIGVGFISFIDLVMLIYLTRPQEKEEEVWYKEPETIGIQ